MNTKNQLTVAITVRQLKLGIVHMLSEPTNVQWPMILNKSRKNPRNTKERL